MECGGLHFTFSFIILSAHIPQNDTHASFRRMRADSVIRRKHMLKMKNKQEFARKHFIAFDMGEPAVVNCGVLQEKRATHKIKCLEKQKKYKLIFYRVRKIVSLGVGCRIWEW